jgi:hypothetical protein
MIHLVLTLMVAFARALFRSRLELLAENLALRQQLAIFKHKRSRPRIGPGELMQLGMQIDERTVSRYLPKRRTSPDKLRSWLAFLRNHQDALVGMDFFSPTPATLASNPPGHLVNLQPALFDKTQAQPVAIAAALTARTKPVRYAQ